MIANQEQFEVTLRQLARLGCLLEAMRLHLQDTEPTLIPLVSEGYVHHIRELQDGFAIICRKPQEWAV